MSITMQEALNPDPNPGRAPQGSSWLKLDGPTVRTVFAGHVAGPGAGVEESDGAEGVMPDGGSAVGHLPARPTGTRACRRYGRSPQRPSSNGAVACADSGGPTMHGARLTRRGRLFVAMAWLVLAVVAVVPIVNVISNGGVVGS